MKAFPAEADDAALVILMSVVRADRKVLPKELELVQSFFAHHLQVEPERLNSIQTAMARYAAEELPKGKLQESVERLPESARELLFSVALEIAMVDDELVESERRELVRIGDSMGFSAHQVQAKLLEVVKRKEDAFSLLGVSPEAGWVEIERAYRAEKEKYSPAGLSKLGVAFQSLALDRLERIDWAYQTLAESYRAEPSTSRAPVEPFARPAPEMFKAPSAFEPPTLDSDSPSKLWKQLPRTLSEIWRGSERDWDIVQRRLALFQPPCQSRDEIGEDYDMSRQNVRQVEIQGKRVLRALLLSGRFHQQHLHSRLLEICQTVFEAMQTARVDPVMKVSDYTRRLHAELGWEVYSTSGLFGLFEDWLELSRATILEEDFVFHAHRADEIEAFKSACEQLHKFLEAQGGSASVELVHETFYRRFVKLRCSAELFLGLLPGTELTEDGRLVLAAEPVQTSVSGVALTPEQIKLGQTIEEYFARSFHHSVPFRVLGLYIQDAARVPYRLATTMLRYHPAIGRERVGGRLYASLRPDWRESGGLRIQCEPSTQELVDESLRERLRGEDEVTWHTILPDLEKETGLPGPELQSYAERSEVCRMVARDGMKWVSLR